MALADDPKDAKDTGPKDSDPSTEVPDLQHGEVTAIKKVISSNQSEALALMLKALQRIDAALFASTDLTDGKLHIGAGNSSTKQGSAFDAWLATYLEDAATKLSKPKDKLSSAEVTKAIKAAAPPADKKDITVTMGTGHFASTSLLYSSVRHEFVHVQQLRKDYLAHIPRSVLHQGVAAPESGSVDKDREVEAYLWEMENLANTGLKDPSEMKLLWEQCSNAFLNASPAATRTFGARFKAAFKNVWAKAMNGYVAVIADHYTKFKVSGSVADPGAVEHFNDGMDLMWSNKGRFDNTWSGHIASHKTALDQATEMITSIKADRFTKLLDKVDAEVAAGYTNSDDGFLRWEEVSNAWSKLETTTKTTLKTRYETTAPLLWEKTFDVLEAEIRKRIAADEFDVAQEFMNNSIGDLFKKAHASVKTATFQKRREALQAEITKARNAKKAKKP